MENVDLIRQWAVEVPQRYSEWWLSVAHEAPWHIAIETSLIIFILWVVFFKKEYNPETRGYGGRAPAPLSDKEKQELIDEWTPAPLLEKATASGPEPLLVRRQLNATEVLVQGSDRPLLDMTSANFLGLSTDKGVKDTAVEAMDELEEEIAQFMGTSEAICYSDAVSCVASAVPAFSKRGDLLIVDRGVNHALQTGTLLSRSKVCWFKHNDMEDLERVIKEAVRKNKRAAATQRRFIIIEGLYKNTGDIAPIKQIVALKNKYKIRVLVDESLSWGVLGKNGRGITEHGDLPVSAVDVIVGSLAATLGSVGGFCVGNREVTDHQRLAGAGYCFSASAPPFLCATARDALLKMTPELLATLRERSKQAHAGLTRMRQFRVVSAEESPVAHAQLVLDEEATEAEQEAKLDEVVAKCVENGVLVSRATYLSENTHRPSPSLKLQVTAAMTDAQINDALNTIADAAASVLGGESASTGAGAGAGRGRRTRARSSTRRSTASTRSTASSRSKAAASSMTVRRSSRRRKPVRSDD